MAGLHKTILKLPLDTRLLQGLLSQCLSSASLCCTQPGPCGTDGASSSPVCGWDITPSSGSFSPIWAVFRKPSCMSSALSPLKVVHPGLDQPPLEAHPTSAGFYFQPSHKTCPCSTGCWARNRLNKLMIKYSTSLVFITIRKHQLHFLFYECTQGNPLQ